MCRISCRKAMSRGLSLNWCGRALMLAAPDQQISFTDPDSRSMATSGRGSGMGGYNVQAVGDQTHPLDVAPEWSIVRTRQAQVGNLGTRAKAAHAAESSTALA